MKMENFHTAGKQKTYNGDNSNRNVTDSCWSLKTLLRNPAI